MIDFIGTVGLEDKIYVTDPCYNSDVWCMSLLEIKRGSYNCYQKTLDDENIISEIYIINDEYDNVNLGDFEFYSNIGVDSGQAGFFNAKYYDIYHNEDNESINDEWYDRVCNIISINGCDEIDGEGFVSHSGYGDGMYPVYVIYNSDREIIGVKIKFIDTGD